MEITIGVQNNPRELSIRTDRSADEIKKVIATAMTSDLLELEDDRGRRVLVPTSTIAYVELGPEETRRVGFSN